MVKKVKFAQEAAFEFRESVEWHESRGKGLGVRFADEIDSTIERIKLNPEMYERTCHPRNFDKRRREPRKVRFDSMFPRRIEEAP